MQNEQVKQPAAQQGNRRLRQYEMAERLGQIGHWSWRVGAATVVWSPQVYRIFGKSPETLELTRENALGLFLPAKQELLKQLLRDAVTHGKGIDFNCAILRGDGSFREVRVIGDTEARPDGRVASLFGVVQDVTEQKKAAVALEVANQRQSDFAEMSSDWHWEMGSDLRFTYFSPLIEKVIGLPADKLVGLSRQELLGNEDLSLEMEMHLAWVEQHKPFRDYRYWRAGPDGNRKCISTSGKPVFDNAGMFLGYRGSGRDVTEEEDSKDALMRANRQMKAANKEKSDAMASLQEANALLEDRAEEMMRVQEEIRHTALHDPLTGIANRRYLDKRMGEMAARCRRNGHWLAALHIDLDRFKQINDTAGHAAGDALLIHVAGILKSTVREEDFVSRVGGDEFLVLCSGDGNMDVLSSIAERIIEQVAVPFDFEGRECWFGASIGIATMQGPDIRPAELQVNADIALYRAKNHGRGRHEYFSSEVQAEIVHNKQIADGIRAGMTRGEFIPHYQPQFDANTFEIAGFEALARWEHPVEGTLPPSVFLKIAEDLSAVATIDRAILEATLADFERWTAAGLRIPKLSVNVSARRLLDPDLIKGLLDMNLPSGVIAFELLESIFLDDADELIAWNIDMLREMGIDVELDDFGSGHASIVSLVKLAPDAIKIDRELVTAITQDRSRRNLVRSIIEIGKSLDVRIVAEGVETLAHADMLRELGADVLQGFYFSGPLAPGDVPGFVRRWRDQRGISAARTGN